MVHRDLATRNVLVVSEREIKISDFGLARQRFEDKDYYQGKNAKDLPIYWSVWLYPVGVGSESVRKWVCQAVGVLGIGCVRNWVH